MHHLLANRWLWVASAAALLLNSLPAATAQDKRPNIFLAIADDWGYPYAGAYGDPVVKTPTFVSSRSSRPSRS
jgi:hypothetical protein